ncbi:MAG: hypothetical protein KC549_16595 [Myxococcales bacterium]|nr:hypothetical protein [Myxococcales bacterium]MCB9546162.1 hypothetical protein [Myxococcales bacterium]
MSPADRLRGVLRRSSTGTLVLAIGSGAENFRACRDACGAAADHPIVPVEGPALTHANPGEVVLVRLSRLDFLPLNLGRSLLRERRLRVVLWASPLLAAYLAHEAPDLFSWIQLTVWWEPETTPEGASPHRLAAEAQAAIDRRDWDVADTLLRRCLALDTQAADERAAAADREALANIAEAQGRSAEAAQWRTASRRTEQVAVSTHRLLAGGPIFVGRDAELALLDAAWTNPDVRVQSLIAWGGAGKTALMRRWLDTLAQAGYDGADRVYAWSFYAQGSTQQGSAALFIDQLLRWLGAERPEEGDPWQKGERLAKLLRGQRTLLLLDGVEPVQHPTGNLAGRLKDPALEVLLESLVEDMDGLCVVSSRLPLTDLDGSVGYRAHDLTRLSAEAGAELLRQRGVRGDEAALQAAAEAYLGHALALQLLGGYLVAYEEGDVDRMVAVRGLLDAESGGQHARQVMRAHEHLLTPSERALLGLVGLFDRAADAEALAALRAPPAIPGLTDDLPDSAGWGAAVARLVKLGLLTAADGGDLDAHPLVREFFGERLRALSPGAWISAQQRLYHHYRQIAAAEPCTLDETKPLFNALFHGCAAGRYSEVLENIFFDRIWPVTETLPGALAARLAALALFFSNPWRIPEPSLALPEQASVMAEAGRTLRSLGKLSEAAELMKATIQRAGEQVDWRGAAASAVTLSGLLLTLGDFNLAEDHARRGLKMSDLCGDIVQRVAVRCTLGDVLHQCGRLAPAGPLFAEAESLWVEGRDVRRRLSRLEGYQHGDFMLTLGHAADVMRRASEDLDWSTQHGSELDISVAHLLCGRAHLKLAEARVEPRGAEAAHHLDLAVLGLRATGRKDLQPLGLLARAALLRGAGRLPEARRDLAEARKVAERGGMRLHLCDCTLESARLRLAEGDHAGARADYLAARAEVEAIGYHRRDPELAALAAALASP